MISEKEKQEWLESAKSESIRNDMRRLASNRRNPFFINGKVDIDGYIDFLNAFNDFINHAPKTFKPIKDHNMQL